MIAAGLPPRRCHSCQTTWPSCMDKREYQSLPCCTGCDHDGDRPRLCTGCGADNLVCARKSANGGRTCCLGCSHVVVRQVQR